MSAESWVELLERRIQQERRCVEECERLVRDLKAAGRPLTSALEANYELLRSLVVLQQELRTVRS